jgi:hypothetical protein
MDERTGQTGRALGTNQVIEPRDFIDVVTVEASHENWVKLMVWGIEHSDRYGANVRIYGEIHNEVLGVLEDTRLRLAAIDLSRFKSSEDVRDAINPTKQDGQSAALKSPVNDDAKQLADSDAWLTKLKAITCSDSEINGVIRALIETDAARDLASRKNSVDVSVDEYFRKTLESPNLTPPVEMKSGKETPKKLTLADRLALLMNGLPDKKTEYALARQIEKVNFAEPDDDDGAQAP